MCLDIDVYTFKQLVGYGLSEGSMVMRRLNVRRLVTELVRISYSWVQLLERSKC